MTQHEPTSTEAADELTIDEILRRFRQYCVHGIMSDTPHMMTFDEAKKALADRDNRLKEAMEGLKDYGHQADCVDACIALIEKGGLS